MHCADTSVVPDPKQAGGEPDSIVQVANLVYAGIKSSQCFSDHFLVQAEKESAISTSRRFHAVKLASDELYKFPLVIMTGEGTFQLTDAERQNLRRFVERGGFLLASAGCSSHEWDRSFRREMAEDLSRAARWPPRHGPSRLPHRLRHHRAEGQARHAAAAGRDQLRRPARRALFAGRPERHGPHARLLLLRRQRNHQRDPDQRQHSGVCTHPLSDSGEPSASRRRASFLSSSLGTQPRVGVGAVVCGACGYWLSPGSDKGNRALTVLVSGDTAAGSFLAAVRRTSPAACCAAGRMSPPREKRARCWVDAGGAANGTSPYDRAKFEAILQGEMALGIVAPSAPRRPEWRGLPAQRVRPPENTVCLVQCARWSRPVGRRAAHVVTAAGRTLAFIGVLSEPTPESDLQIRAAGTRRLSKHSIEFAKSTPSTPSSCWRTCRRKNCTSREALPEADLVVGGPTGQSVPPQQIGPTMLASATNKGKFLARFDQPARNEPPNHGQAGAARLWK